MDLLIIVTVALCILFFDKSKGKDFSQQLSEETEYVDTNDYEVRETKLNDAYVNDDSAFMEIAVALGFGEKTEC